MTHFSMNNLFLPIIAFFFIALLEAPLFMVMAGLAVSCFYFAEHDWSAVQMVIIEINRLASMPVLTALPLFTFTGCLLTKTHAPQRIANFIQALFGWLPGGFGIAALCACAFFTALTGASGVTIVALGGVLYPILKQQNYRESFSLGLLTTSGSLGLLFPPSLPIILYGVVAQVDINRIFRAAWIPGILLIVVLSAYAFFYTVIHLRPQHKTSFDRLTYRPRLKRAFMEGLWEWPMIALIFIGVYGGFFTIVEVSAVLAVYLIIVECVILKEIRFFRQIPGIMIESAQLSGAIMIILAMSLGFTGFLVDAQIPGKILSRLTELTDNPFVFLAGLNLFLLAVGCVMDIFSAIVIIVPIMVPIALTYGVDPIHLCIIFMVNLEIGYSTPPVGINLFIASLKFDKPVAALYRASLPYLVILLLTLVLITYVPSLSLFFVR
jgi:C4-dicarboxylate transporter, DctM subunit